MLASVFPPCPDSQCLFTRLGQHTFLPHAYVFPRLSQHIHKEDRQVPPTSALPGFQQRQGPAVKKIDGCVPAFRFDIT